LKAMIVHNQTILVTGAGSGIGRAVAETLAAHGATVILVGRTPKKLESTYDAILENSGTPPIIHPLNLESAQGDEYDTLINACETEFGHLDGLIHAAAIPGQHTVISHIPPHDWIRVLQTNLTSVFLLTKYCLPLLHAAPAGKVVFTLDGHATQGDAHWGAYGVAKAGVKAFADTLASEHENSTLQVHQLDPGPTNTGLRRQAFPAEEISHLNTPATVATRYLALFQR